jgi:hypothetical protein
MVVVCSLIKKPISVVLKEDVSHLEFKETRLPFLKELDADKQHAIYQQDYTHSNANHPESMILSESWLVGLWLLAFVLVTRG